MKVIDECADLSVNSTTPFLRRCFDNTYYIEVYNDGTEVAENVEMLLNLDKHFEFLSSDMDLISQNGTALSFSIPEILPRQNFRGHVTFNLSCEVELGEAHYSSAELIYDNPCNSGTRQMIAFECRENIGSYDPNDKQTYVDDILNAVVIDEDSSIEHLIRFQNTGTDTAFTVRVEDDLGEAFELSEIYPVSASHDYEWEMFRNKLSVIFNDINLVDSLSNEKASHGFIKFRAKFKDKRPNPGSVINNTAAIYFDFNDPIITNTVGNYYLCKHESVTVNASICPGEEYEGYTGAGTYVDDFFISMGCDSVRILELEILDLADSACITYTQELSESMLAVYPVPTQDILNVRYAGSTKLTNYSIKDIVGREVMSGAATSSFQIETGGLTSSLYMLQLMRKDKIVVNKRVVVAR